MGLTQLKKANFILNNEKDFQQAQLAGDGTYPWGEKFHGKN